MHWRLKVIPQPNQLWVRDVTEQQIAQVKSIEEDKVLLNKFNSVHSADDRVSKLPLKTFKKNYLHIGLYPRTGETWVLEVEPLQHAAITEKFLNKLGNDNYKLIDFLTTHRLVGKRRPRSGELWVEKQVQSMPLVEVNIIPPTVSALPDLKINYRYAQLKSDEYINTNTVYTATESQFMNFYRHIPNTDAEILNSREDMKYLQLSTLAYEKFSQSLMHAHVYHFNDYIPIDDLDMFQKRNIISHIKEHPIKKNSLIWQWQATILKESIKKRRK